MLGTDLHKDTVNKFLDDIVSAIWDIAGNYDDLCYVEKEMAIRKVEALRKYIKEV